MEESQGKPDATSFNRENSWQDEVFTKVIRAGTRTYYFDVKCIRNNGRYITITESKRKIDNSGKPFYLKHKIFLYQEDIEKFTEGLKEAISHVGVNNHQAVVVPGDEENSPSVKTSGDGDEFTNIDFEDLGNNG